MQPTATPGLAPLPCNCTMVLPPPLEIFPEMWEKGTELVFPVGSVLYLEKNFTPEDTSNKACKWYSSDESVATVTEDL